MTALLDKAGITSVPVGSASKTALCFTPLILLQPLNSVEKGEHLNSIPSLLCAAWLLLLHGSEHDRQCQNDSGRTIGVNWNHRQYWRFWGNRNCLKRLLGMRSRSNGIHSGLISGNNTPSISFGSCPKAKARCDNADNYPSVRLDWVGVVETPTGYPKLFHQFFPQCPDLPTDPKLKNGLKRY